MPPITTAIRSASTRPRIARSVVSCIIELLAVMKVSAASPTKNRTTANDTGPGINAATATLSPNAAADTAISTMPGSGRRADSSAPARVPTAIAEVSRPYWLASPWNTVTDMVEMKMGAHHQIDIARRESGGAQILQIARIQLVNLGQPGQIEAAACRAVGQDPGDQGQERGLGLPARRRRCGS